MCLAPGLRGPSASLASRPSTTTLCHCDWPNNSSQYHTSHIQIEDGRCSCSCGKICCHTNKIKISFQSQTQKHSVGREKGQHRALTTISTPAPGGWLGSYLKFLPVARWRPPVRLPRRCVATPAWTTWPRRPAPCCRTLLRSTRCSPTSTAWTLLTYRYAPMERDLYHYY